MSIQSRDLTNRHAPLGGPDAEPAGPARTARIQALETATQEIRENRESREVPADDRDPTSGARRAGATLARPASPAPNGRQEGATSPRRTYRGICAAPSLPDDRRSWVRQLGLPAERAALDPVLSSSTPTAGLVAPLALRLGNGSSMKEIPASNYFFSDAGQIRSEFRELARFVLRRTPEAQANFDQALTLDHARHEMSFRAKDPETDHYDKIFHVPVHGIPVPLRESHFRALVDSAGPVMRALRDMLQAVYSRPNPTAEDLGIQGMPANDQERVLAAIGLAGGDGMNVYFEPKLVHPNMKDYPFLAVAGFDAAIAGLDGEPDPIFFEYNLGTPSGLSNNIQLLDSLRTKDPAMFRQIERRLPEDDTFLELKRVIDSNALKWTREPRGISVVLSPGVFNGAHPDVASIANFSGMPLVNPSDLYQDEDGWIRLNTGEPGEHPVVTGIYGRMEESFFLQNSDDAVPIRGPEYLGAAKIGEELGIELQPGVCYEYVYDESNKILDVRRDEQGKPKLQEVYESIGRDPNRPGEKPGSFLRAILDRKLYFSGLGGRVVDDKRIFQAVSQHLAPKYAEPGRPIAQPPRTLDPSEYECFYSSDRLEDYVVKVPDESGGSGVYLLVNLPPEKRAAVVEEVKATPGRYIVQHFTRPAVMTSAEPGPDGKPAYVSLANDWRIFALMDAEGQVSGGPNSLLLRAAKPLSASTNTSQGAGYGIGVVLAEHPVREPGGPVLPLAPRSDWTGKSRLDDLDWFLEQLNFVSVVADPERGELLRGGPVARLADLNRDVMDLLGRDFTTLMSDARDFEDGKIDQETFYRAVLSFRHRLLAQDAFPIKGIGGKIHAALGLHRFLDQFNLVSDAADPVNRQSLDPAQARVLLSRLREAGDLLPTSTAPLAKALSDYCDSAIDQAALHAVLLDHRVRLLEETSFPPLVALNVHRTLAQKPPRTEPRAPSETQEAQAIRAHALRAQLKLRHFADPEKVRTDIFHGAQHNKFEVGAYRHAPEPHVQQAIAALRAAGGELRAIRRQNAETQEWLDEVAGAYFRVDERGRPIIGIDLTQKLALAGLAHEMVHFGDWKRATEALVAAGVAEPDARRRAFEDVDARAWFQGERDAVDAEMEAEARLTGPWNQGQPGPQTWRDDGYVLRVCYPEVEGIRIALYRSTQQGASLDRPLVRELMEKAVRTALDTRQRRFDEEMAEARRASEPGERNRRIAKAYAGLEVPVYRLIFNDSTVDRFVTDGTLDRLQALFTEVLSDLAPRTPTIPLDGPRLRAQAKAAKMRLAFKASQQQ